MLMERYISDILLELIYQLTSLSVTCVLKDEDVIYICGTDEHGTPISITADKEGITPQEVVNRYHQSIKEAFDGIGIEFDNFSGTARPPHYKLASEFFLQLYNKDFIKPKITLQFYCEHDKRYLPDRYVE